MPRKDTKLEKLSEMIYATVEEISNLKVDGLDHMFMEIYSEQACQLTDSRQQNKVKHSLKDIVGIVFFAVLAANDEWTEIADFATDERETLKKYLDLPNGIPSHDTIQRVFFILDPDELQNMLVNILVQLVNTAGKRLDEYLYKNEELGCCIKDVIAADGKETHNTGKKNSDNINDKRNLNKFNVMSTEWGICLSSTKIDEKSNEIPEMQKVMEQFDFRGCVVTADAMNTQKETARAIVEETHGDYCLALKENQKTAYYEVKEYFANEKLLKEIMAAAGQYVKETEVTTYNTITREYFIKNAIIWCEARKEGKILSSIGYERR